MPEPEPCGVSLIKLDHLYVPPACVDCDDFADPGITPYFIVYHEIIGHHENVSFSAISMITDGHGKFWDILNIGTQIHLGPEVAVSDVYLAKVNRDISLYVNCVLMR